MSRHFFPGWELGFYYKQNLEIRVVLHADEQVLDGFSLVSWVELTGLQFVLNVGGKLR